MRKNLLLLLPSVFWAGCGLDWGNNRHHYYSTNFDVDDGKYMLAWAADDDGAQFRYVVGDVECPLNDSRVQTWPRDLETFAGVTVVLPKDAGARLRSRADSLLRAVRKRNRNASVHVVYDDDRWSGFRNLKDVVDRLAELRAEAKKRRPRERSMFGGLTEVVMRAMFASMVPDAMVVPSDDGFLMATGFYDKSHTAVSPAEIEIRAVSQADVLAWARTPVDRNAMSAPMKLTARSVIVIRPKDAPGARCLALVEALGRLDNVSAVYLSAKQTYAELKTPDGLRAYLSDTDSPGTSEGSRASEDP